MTWLAHAACKGTDPDLFFPDKRGDECLLEALTQRDAGVWGGTNEVERRTLRRLLGVGRTSKVQHGTRGCWRTGCRQVCCVLAQRAYKATRRELETEKSRNYRAGLRESA